MEMEWTPGKVRKMRKADQYRVNPENGCLEVYQIDVPVELEDWEKEGLKKQAEMRKKRKTQKNIVGAIHESPTGNGEKTDERNSDLSD